MVQESKHNIGLCQIIVGKRLYGLILACVASVIREGEGNEEGREEKMRGDWGVPSPQFPSFFLASLNPPPLPRLRRLHRLVSYLINVVKVTIYSIAELLLPWVVFRCNWFVMLLPQQYIHDLCTDKILNSRSGYVALSLSTYVVCLGKA